MDLNSWKLDSSLIFWIFSCSAFKFTLFLYNGKNYSTIEWWNINWRLKIYLLVCKERPDLVLIDHVFVYICKKYLWLPFFWQVSFPILFLRIFTTTKVIFYCHFPDYLLVNRFSRLRSLYRLPLNFLEQVSTGMVIFVFFYDNTTYLIEFRHIKF